MPDRRAVPFSAVREMALALPGAEEGTAYGSPAFKVDGKMFACLTSHRSAEPNTLAVRIDFDQRDELIAEERSKTQTQVKLERARAAIGFTVKSGWASAVLLAGPLTVPHVLDSRRINLSDPAVPESRQPYHAGFATARSSGRELSRLIASVEEFGRLSATSLIREHQAGHELHVAGIVVGSLIDPERVANAHVRIHALEGKLFRGVIEDAAARSGLDYSTWRERDLYGLAADILKRREQELRTQVAVIGRNVHRSWRAEEKAAALAAWLVLATLGRQ